MYAYEESRYWGYAAYRHGELIATGPNPVPNGVSAEATEIRWIESQPEVDRPVEAL